MNDFLTKISSIGRSVPGTNPSCGDFDIKDPQGNTSTDGTARSSPPKEPLHDFISCRETDLAPSTGSTSTQQNKDICDSPIFLCLDGALPFSPA